MNISLALRKVRFEKGMKQSYVAEKAKTSASYLSQIESGAKHPSKGMVQKLCKIYGVPYITLAWYGTEAKDIQPSKKKAFATLKPLIDNLTSEFLK